MSVIKICLLTRLLLHRSFLKLHHSQILEQREVYFLYFTNRMTAATKLNIIKAVHSLIWVFFNAVIFYLYYAANSNKIDKWVWIGIGFILLEGLVLLVFKKICPVTLFARKYSNSTKDNFDIFLPNWLAKYNKLIYTTCLLLY